MYVHLFVNLNVYIIFHGNTNNIIIYYYIVLIIDDIMFKVLLKNFNFMKVVNVNKGIQFVLF